QSVNKSVNSVGVIITNHHNKVGLTTEQRQPQSRQQSKSIVSMSSMNAMLVVVVASVAVACMMSSYCEAKDVGLVHSLIRRDSTEKSMHSHLSRKVLERACAAGKDAIDEIIACFSNNMAAKAMLKPELALKCHKEAFNIEFDMNDIEKHRQLICENRDKFEMMTACVYRQATANVDIKQREIFAEAMVDLGLCIINALN
ncbi:hypothetical protein GZH46_02365, partial [Fragariocoptes setiger]